MSYYGRAEAIRMKLESYGDKRPDASMCRHIARRMLPSLKLCSDHVLLLPDRSSRIMENLPRRAAHELELKGRSGEEREETRHALTAAGVGWGDRGGRNAGDRAYGERDRTYTYCAHHGEGQGHNTPECIVMRREFDTYYGDFQEYLLTRGLGPYAGRGGGRGAEGKYRQQPYPNDSVARWSRGHSPEQQRRPPPGHGPGTGGYADTYPGGRGHENWHHPSGGRGRGRGEGFGQVPPPNFRLESFSTHRVTLLRQIIPTRTNTWDTPVWRQQRGTGHHHRRRSRRLPSKSSSTNNTKNSKRARLLPRLPLLL